MTTAQSIRQLKATGFTREQAEVTTRRARAQSTRTAKQRGSSAGTKPTQPRK